MGTVNKHNRSMLRGGLGFGLAQGFRKKSISALHLALGVMLSCLVTSEAIASSDFDPLVPADYSENCPAPGAGEHIVVLHPHPDDELFVPTPILLRAAQNGAHITLISLADGGNGGDSRPSETPNCNEVAGVPRDMDSYFSVEYYLCMADVRASATGESVAFAVALEALDGDPNNGNVRRIQFQLYDGWRESTWLGAELDENGLPPFLQLDNNRRYWAAFLTGFEKRQLKRALRGPEKNIVIPNGLRQFGQGNEALAAKVIKLKLKFANKSPYLQKIADAKLKRFVRDIIKVIDKDRPIDILFAFDPRIGYTGHQNHILTGMLVQDAVAGLPKKSKPRLTLYGSGAVPGFSGSLFASETVKSSPIDPATVVGGSINSPYYALAVTGQSNGDLTEEKDVRVCSFVAPPEPSEIEALLGIAFSSYPSQAGAVGNVALFDFARNIAPLSPVRELPDPILGFQKDSFALDCLDFPDAMCLLLVSNQVVFITHEQLVEDDADGTSDQIIEILGSPNLDREPSGHHH